jgi:predicted nucleic acid-binding protein
MEAAFWDSSALVPLLIQQSSSANVRQLTRNFEVIVWWSTPIEVKSTLARLIRMSQITSAEFADAQVDMNALRQSWQEVAPSDQLRSLAESFLDRFSLRAADAQQLAAAYVWASAKPRGRTFLSGDRQLLDAARQLGFQAIET